MRVPAAMLVMRDVLRALAFIPFLGVTVRVHPGDHDDVHAIPAGKGEPPHLHHDVRYALATDAPDDARLDAAESKALRWFTLDEALVKMGEPGAARALARLRRLLG